MGRLALLLSAAALVTACGDETPPPQGCAADARADSYVAGLAKDAGRLTVKILDATPAPPDRGDNTWMLQISEGAAPVGTATVTDRPWMPDHGHGSTPAMFHGRATGDGKFELGPMNMFMPGIWRHTISVETGGQPAETTEFFFCVQG